MLESNSRKWKVESLEVLSKEDHVFESRRLQVDAFDPW